ncbi:MAG: R3H domain-containing nucleic acid-binding protein [Cyanobacteria bacterium J06614_10]
MKKSTDWLEKLLALQGLQASVSGDQTVGDLGDDSYWLTIDDATLSDAEINTLIGERGQVLDAIQYLANTILNMGADEADQHSYTVELRGYRKKRQAELKTLAEEAANEVLNNGKAEHEVKGLSSAERRQVHGLLGEYEQLKTFSRGREPERHLVVQRIDLSDIDLSDTENEPDTESE